jgi:hypothetical protein
MSLMDISYGLARRHDMIVFNAPQLPLGDLEAKDREGIMTNPLMKSFRCGDQDGFDLIRLFLGWYKNLPQPKPSAVLAISSFLGRSNILSVFNEQGLAPNFIAEPRVSLRALLHPRAESLIGKPELLADRAIEMIDRKWTKRLCVLETHE